MQIDKELQPLTVNQLELAMKFLEFPRDQLPKELVDLSEVQWWSIHLLLVRLKNEREESQLH